MNSNLLTVLFIVSTFCSNFYNAENDFSDCANLSAEQLKTAFKNMKTLVGGLEISFTSYKSLKFLAELQRIESKAKTLLNYKKISNVYMEGNICNAGNLAKKSCIVPKVGCENLVGDLKIGPKFGFKKVTSLKFLYGSLIVKNSSLTDFKIFENLLEIVQLNSTKLAIDVQGNSNPPCKFNETFLSNNTASKFPKNCSTVCGILLINGTTDLSAEQLTELFKNMRILVGGLHIRNATFKNLRFLSDHTRYPMYDAQLEITYNSELRELGLLNLTTIKSSVVVIYRNEKLKKLNLPKLETAKFLENRTIQLQMASAKFPEFCIKTQELDAFTRKRNKCDLIINSNICIPKNAPKVCTVPTVGCERLIGDLNITKGFDVRKVESLKRLYGTLNITNTDFNDFRFLGNLTHILCLLHKPALFVVGNKNLTNMEFPNLRKRSSPLQHQAKLNPLQHQQKTKLAIFLE
ncbi:Protein CBG13815 [Caenorhabditis briggsae]|uniref:Protein CBG13815 n=1 Tax=Caenorhabditis briggsae TaxID=6238 RepID=A8XIR8_CAEBR|nr:Protein CBG13815 [Caenorhabditis briggsae]CAP32543.2 Protein CBG13815 [Caenorhabditis briggsae]